MKKNVLLLVFALCFPMIFSAQGNDDDIYYVPGKNRKAEKVIVKKEVEVTTVYTAPARTTVVQDRKGKVRDVDEYNRRYDTSDYTFISEKDTFYIQEKEQDDYEYAERIIRFRNPRYAVFISSPSYWNRVYGINSWDWNIYVDDWYAFPAYGNPLWWNGRYGSMGWGGYYGGYGGYGYYPGYYGGGYWGHYSYYYPSYYYDGRHSSGYRARNVYHNNRQSVYAPNRTGRSSVSSTRRSPAYESSGIRRVGATSSTGRQNNTQEVQRRESSSSTRTVGTRTATEQRQGTTTRSSTSSTPASTYTRPSSTRGSSAASESSRSSNTTTDNQSTKQESSATTSSRQSSSESTGRSSTGTGSSSSRSNSYSSGSSSSGSRSSGSYSDGGSSRSSSGGSGGSSSSSSSSRRR